MILQKIQLFPNDFTLQFQRDQFSTKVCFVMTINKAQGQPLEHYSIDLESNCYSHRQLFLVFSCKGKLTIYKFMHQEKETLNVVYSEVLK